MSPRICEATRSHSSAPPWELDPRRSSADGAGHRLQQRRLTTHTQRSVYIPNKTMRDAVISTGRQRRGTPAQDPSTDLQLLLQVTQRVGLRVARGRGRAEAAAVAMALRARPRVRFTALPRD